MVRKLSDECWAAIAVELLKSLYLGSLKTYREISKDVAKYCNGKSPSIAYISYVKRALDTLPRTLRTVTTSVRRKIPESATEYVAMILHILTDAELARSVLNTYLNLVEGDLGGIKARDRISEVAKTLLNIYGDIGIDEVISCYVRNYLLTLSTMLSDISVLLHYSAYTQVRDKVRVRAYITVNDELFKEISELAQIARTLSTEANMSSNRSILISIIRELIGVNSEDGLLSRVHNVVTKVLKAKYLGIPLPLLFLITYYVTNYITEETKDRARDVISKYGLTKEAVEMLRRFVKEIVSKVGKDVKILQRVSESTLVPKEIVKEIISSFKINYRVILSRKNVLLITLNMRSMKSLEFTE